MVLDRRKGVKMTKTYPLSEIKKVMIKVYDESESKTLPVKEWDVELVINRLKKHLFKE